jgi:hypothetical protein
LHGHQCGTCGGITLDERRALEFLKQAIPNSGEHEGRWVLDCAQLHSVTWKFVELTAEQHVFILRN